jgi:hypothetical protein
MNHPFLILSSVFVSELTPVIFAKNQAILSAYKTLLKKLIASSITPGRVIQKFRIWEKNLLIAMGDSGNWH